MDTLQIQLDVLNKKAIFSGTKALGAYTTIAVRCYNFPTAPDTATMKAVIYSDNGTALSICGAFAEDDNTSGLYEATLSLSTDQAIAYFSTKNPNFQQELALVISDINNLYCNSKIAVKNNPNAIPGSPTPVTTYFVRVSDLGWSVDMGALSDLRTVTDLTSIDDLFRAFLTLTKDLKSKGVV